MKILKLTVPLLLVASILLGLCACSILERRNVSVPDMTTVLETLTSRDKTQPNITLNELINEDTILLDETSIREIGCTLDVFSLSQYEEATEHDHLHAFLSARNGINDENIKLCLSNTVDQEAEDSIYITYCEYTDKEKAKEVFEHLVLNSAALSEEQFNYNNACFYEKTIRSEKYCIAQGGGLNENGGCVLFQTENKLFYIKYYNPDPSFGYGNFIRYTNVINELNIPVINKSPIDPINYFELASRVVYGHIENDDITVSDEEGTRTFNLKDAKIYNKKNINNVKDEEYENGACWVTLRYNFEEDGNNADNKYDILEAYIWSYTP